MSKNAVIALVVIVLILIAGGVVLAMRGSSSTPSASANPYQNSAYDATAGLPPVTNGAAQAPAASNAASTGAMAPAVVTYTDQGFSPKTITVSVGQTVRFVNNSSHQMWVASGQHPIHSDYDGTTLQQHCANGVNTKGDFDECTAVAPGTVYSFAFPKAGTFDYHNHVQTSDTGLVVVK